MSLKQMLKMSDIQFAIYCRNANASFRQSSLTCISPVIRPALTVGNDVTLLVEPQQLDECNNNVPEDDVVVVLPPAPRSKTSSNSSSPSPSLCSSPSSPLSQSSSTASSSSDAVSPANTHSHTNSN